MANNVTRTRYIHDFARSLQGRLKITLGEFATLRSAQEVAKQVWNSHLSKIEGYLFTLSDETLGRLASTGSGHVEYDGDRNRSTSGDERRVKLVDVAPHAWAHEDWRYWSGVGLVTRLATFAVIAGMADNLWEEIRKERTRQADFEHTSEFRDEIQAFRRGEDVDLSR